MSAFPLTASAQTSAAATGQAPTAQSGQVIITEIMYDVSGADTGREWIEVFNRGTAPVKLIAWKLLENGIKHKITAGSGTDFLAPNSYTVITDNPSAFRADHPSYAGALFDSAFSLSNTADTLALFDASSTEVSAVSYQSSWGAAGDGNSLNRPPDGSGAFVPRAPSPGEAMSATAIPPPAPKTAALPHARTRSSQSSAGGAPSDSFAGDSGAQADTASAAAAAVPAAPAEQSSAGGPAFFASSAWWWIAAASLALLGGGAMLVSRVKSKREWRIEESSG